MRKQIVINKVLKELLKAKGLSSKTLSDLSEVPLSTISTWTTSPNAKPKNLDHLASVAETLGVTIDALLYGEATSIADIEAVPQQQILKGIYYIDLRKIDIESSPKLNKKK